MLLCRAFVCCILKPVFTLNGDSLKLLSRLSRLAVTLSDHLRTLRLWASRSFDWNSTVACELQQCVLPLFVASESHSVQERTAFSPEKWNTQLIIAAGARGRPRVCVCVYVRGRRERENKDHPFPAGYTPSLYFPDHLQAEFLKFQYIVFIA